MPLQDHPKVIRSCHSCIIRTTLASREFGGCADPRYVPSCEGWVWLCRSVCIVRASTALLSLACDVLVPENIFAQPEVLRLHVKNTSKLYLLKRLQDMVVVLMQFLTAILVGGQLSSGLVGGLLRVRRGATTVEDMSEEVITLGFDRKIE